MHSKNEKSHVTSEQSGRTPAKSRVTGDSRVRERVRDFFDLLFFWPQVTVQIVVNTKSYTTNVRQTQSYDAKVTTGVGFGARKYPSAQKVPKMQML